MAVRATGTTAHPKARILVAGVGNIFLRDDGFGPEVARRLAGGAGGALGAADGSAPGAADAHSARQGMLAVDYGIRGMHLAYDLLAGADLLVLVDTVPPKQPGEAAPGSIRVLRIRPEDLDANTSLDPHGMDPAAVLGRLHSLGGELPLTYVVGCVPADVSDGIGLSTPVAAAVPGAMAAVIELIAQHDSSVPRPVPG